MKKFATGSPTRRDVVRGIGVTGLGAAASAPLTGRAFAQTKKPVNISFWTFDNPQQRPWVHKRVKMFMEQNPHVKVDFQWFAFGDLGKKISVGFATGTAPDGFVSQDWFMPIWLDKGLLAPLDVKQLGYEFLWRLYRGFCQGVRRRRDQGRQGLRLSDVVLRLLQLSQRQAVQGGRVSMPKRTGRRTGSNSAKSPSE